METTETQVAEQPTPVEVMPEPMLNWNVAFSENTVALTLSGTTAARIACSLAATENLINALNMALTAARGMAAARQLGVPLVVDHGIAKAQ